MPRNLAKKAGKQQTRMAALDKLGTPASSRAGSEDEADDSLSEISAISAAAAAADEETLVDDQLRHCVDDLGEKRTSVREAALTKLDRLLARYYCGDFFESNPSSQEAMLQLLVRSLRKPGSTLEAILAAKGIGLVFINDGDEQEELFGMVLSLLKNTITDALDVRLKHQCIETLALITLIAASNADTRGGLDYFFKILISNGESLQPDEKLKQGAMDELLCTSLRAYGLLYAALFGDGRGTWEDAWDESQGVMPAHIDFLESTSKENRVAAGENVALMFDCVQVSHKHAQEMSEFEVEDKPEYEEIDDLVDMLQRLSTDSNRRVNKQDRKEQKSAFRDIIRSVEEGSRPKQKLKIGGQNMLFRGWARIIMLAAFRSFLGAGLAQHLQENELLENVLASGISNGTASEDEESESEEEEEAGEGFEMEDDMSLSKSAASKRERARRLKRSKKL
ncbi:interferon-related developmental regulator-domain-containing protein [Zychaea mexicana]|uniref:interferon-related developmental regulator-domain-containing protein n=1 Tax=Zychaea mexicana TaxID=64656 RepID=UPI0022FE5406|nr:interferon-related developmental regulator-domain-containing protein [Zychaea mexicana]KAI9491503.1 interferon-related developmental regulator-domain-containing protein [Zychaea mexicana]